MSSGGEDEVANAASKAKCRACCHCFLALIFSAVLVPLLFINVFGFEYIATRMMMSGVDSSVAGRQLLHHVGLIEEVKIEIEQWEDCGKTTGFDWTGENSGKGDSATELEGLTPLTSKGPARKFGKRKKKRAKRLKRVKRDGLGAILKGRIAAGEDTKENEFPWMLQLGLLRNKGKKFQTVCAATLILDQWALTAAQCCNDGQWEGGKNPKLVGIGKPEPGGKGKPGKLYEVEKCVMHRDFNPGDDEIYKNDIALLKLKTKLPKPGLSDEYNVICLPEFKQEFKENVPFYIAGWGSTATRNNYTKSLMKGEVHPNDPLHFCDDNDDDRLEGTQLCVKGLEKSIEDYMVQNGSLVKREARACYGDGGDPLMYPDRKHGKFFMVGMASWAHSYGKSTDPSVKEDEDKFNCDIWNHHSHFQNVAMFIDWIADTVISA